MKKISLFLPALCAGMLSFGQVPDSITTRFNTAHPGVSQVEWKTTDKGYKVSFIDTMKMEHFIMYDNTGKLHEHRYRLASWDVPATVSGYYTRSYPMEKEYRVWVLIDKWGNRNYYIKRRSEVLYFDKEGKYSRKEKTDEANKNK